MVITGCFIVSHPFLLALLVAAAVLAFLLPELLEDESP
jgi:hypothetical protein